LKLCSGTADIRSSSCISIASKTQPSTLGSLATAQLRRQHSWPTPQSLQGRMRRVPHPCAFFWRMGGKPRISIRRTPRKVAFSSTTTVTSKSKVNSCNTHKRRKHQASANPVFDPSHRPQDPMYLHKTTHRPLYAEALKAAVEAGFDDVLFLNFARSHRRRHPQHLRRERWSAHHAAHRVRTSARRPTPPSPGNEPSAIERVLYPEDLRQADAIFLSNAVRGLRRTTIDWKPSSPIRRASTLQAAFAVGGSIAAEESYDIPAASQNTQNQYIVAVDS